MDSRLPGRVLLACCAILLPAVLTLALPPLLFDTTLLEFAPYYNDEVEYWHETLTFTRVGFSGGYYTLDEKPAPAAFSHFGCHGPAFPVLYGVIGSALGWRLNSAPLFNLGFVTLALICFVLFTRPGIHRLALIAMLVGTFSPLLLMLTSSMQDSVHHAIAIIAAAVFGSWIVRAATPPSWAVLGFVAFVLLASLLRVSWVVLLLPVLLLLRRRTPSTIALTSAATVFLTIGAALVSAYLAAPHPAAPIFRLFENRGLVAILERTGDNLSGLFAFRGAHPLEIFQRYAIMVVLVTALASVVSAWVRGKPTIHGDSERRGAVTESLFHIANLGLPLGLSLVMYDMFDWRDYRILSAHLLLSLLVAIMTGSRRRLIAVLLLGQILMMPAFLGAYREYSGHYFHVDRDELERVRHELDVMRYEPGADAWCNTLLTSLDDRRLVAVPPGIGISYFFSDVELPLRSRYVLIDEAWTRDNAALVGRLDLEPIGRTTIGMLYYNGTAACN